MNHLIQIDRDLHAHDNYVVGMQLFHGPLKLKGHTEAISIK